MDHPWWKPRSLCSVAYVVVDGAVIPDAAWARRSASGLVELLTPAPGRCLHREQVLDVRWPDSSPEQARPRLHTAAHYARRALGDPSSRDAARRRPHPSPPGGGFLELPVAIAAAPCGSSSDWTAPCDRPGAGAAPRPGSAGPAPTSPGPRATTAAPTACCRERRTASMPAVSPWTPAGAVPRSPAARLVPGGPGHPPARRLMPLGPRPVPRERGGPGGGVRQRLRAWPVIGR